MYNIIHIYMTRKMTTSSYNRSILQSPLKNNRCLKYYKSEYRNDDEQNKNITMPLPLPFSLPMALLPKSDKKRKIIEYSANYIKPYKVDR